MVVGFQEEKVVIWPGRVLTQGAAMGVLAEEPALKKPAEQGVIATSTVPGVDWCWEWTGDRRPIGRHRASVR